MANMYAKIKLENEELQLNILANSFSLSDTAESFNNCSFSFISPSVSFFSIKQGMKVDIMFGEEILFAGFVYDCDHVVDRRRVIYNVTLQGYDYIVKKRNIKRSFYEVYAGEIVMWIIKNCLSEEGLSYDKIHYGKQIIENYYYVSCYDAIDDIAKKSNCLWFVDQYKRLNFISRYSDKMLADPLNLEYEDVIGGDIELQHTQYAYRNVQYLTGCTGCTTVEKYFTVHEDGNLSTLDCGYKILSKPSVGLITEAGGLQEQEVDKKGKEEDSTAHFFYEENSESISIKFKSGEEKFPAGTQIRVLFYGGYTMNIEHQDESEIARLKEIDETTGRYENTDSCDQIGYENCLKYAQGLVDQNKEEGYELYFRVKYELGNKYFPGVVIPITLACAGLNEEKFMVTSRDLVINGETLYWDIKTLRGPLVEDWTAYYEALSNGKGGVNDAKGGGAAGAIGKGNNIPAINADGTPDYDGWETGKTGTDDEGNPIYHDPDDEMTDSDYSKIDETDPVHNSDVLDDAKGENLVSYTYEKTWVQTDRPNPFGVMLFPSYTLFPSTSLYPCSDYVQPITQMKYYYDGGFGSCSVYGSEKSGDGTNIYNTFMIPTSVGGHITKLEFLSTVGRGTVMDTIVVDFNKVKTTEKYQITHIEKKGW